MLPFLKNKEGSAAVSTDKKTVGGKPGAGILGAIAKDFLSAVKSSDHALLKSALEAFAEHIREEDDKADSKKDNDKDKKEKPKK